MSQDNVIKLKNPEPFIDDPITSYASFIPYLLLLPTSGLTY